MKALVPLARQNPKACEQLADTIARLALRSHQIQKLYSAWLRSKPSVRKRILEDPLLFLRAQEEQKNPFCRKQGIGQKPILPAGRYHFEPGQEMQHDTSRTGSPAWPPPPTATGSASRSRTGC